ncbi:Arf-GAP with Rho-GAP domain, ANK repeat and PH domain-containing protein 2, partial [Orchesella cincta]
MCVLNQGKIDLSSQNKGSYMYLSLQVVMTTDFCMPKGGFFDLTHTLYMDSESRTVNVKPVPLPRKSNKNFEPRETKSLSPKPSTESSSDINSNIDHLLEPKPNVSKFSSPPTTSPSSKPVPLPRKFLRSNGTPSSSCGNMPDLTNFPSAPHSISGSVKSEDFEDVDDDIDYENIPSRPNMQPKDSENKRGTINLFKRVVGDPFEDFESSIKETDTLSTLSFRSPLEDLDDAARSRISISSLSSSTTSTSKSSSDYSDHYMEPPPARPLPAELTVGGKWRRSTGSPGGSGHSYSSNTVPSRPKRSPNIILPRLSSLEESEVMKSTSPNGKKQVGKMLSCPPGSGPPSGIRDSSELCYEPISSYSTSPSGGKFNTISFSSTKAISNSGNISSSSSSNTAECNLPINSNFCNSKRITVPNVERMPFTAQSLTNHASFKGGEAESRRHFDPTAYDVSDVHRASFPNKISSPFLDDLKGRNRRSLATPVSGSQELKSESESERVSRGSSVILRRHSSSRSTSSSVGSSSGSSRSSYKKNVHEYDEVAIEDGAVVFLSHSSSDSSATLRNNSCSSLTSRNSVVQEFDPLFDARTNNVSTGFPPTAKPLDLNDTQQHRYEYIDTDGDDGPDTSYDGSTTSDDGRVPPPLPAGPMCMDNPGYSPCTPRHSREIKTIDEMYEPVSSPLDGVSPKSSPKPRMGTRVLRSKTEEFTKQGIIVPPPTVSSPPALEQHYEKSPPVSIPDGGSMSLLANPSTAVQIPAPATSVGVNQSNFFRKFSSKFRLNAIKEERDADKRSESLINSEETYSSITTPCTKCMEPHPESTKCKFVPVYRQNIVFSSHLFKTSGLSKREFSKKWAVLAKGKLTFYNEKSDVVSEYPLDRFAVVSKKNEHRVSQSQTDLKCFELGFAGGKTSNAVFASATEGERCAWMQKFIEVYTSAFPTSVLSNFDKGGWCFIKETVTSDWRPCWLILKDRSLYYSYWRGDESYEMDLRKAREVALSQKDEEYKCPYIENTDVLTVDFICKILYIQTESSKVTSSWEKVIKSTSSQNGSEFHEMQLTLDNVPVIVDKCIDFLCAHGTRTDGIYRQSGSNTRITQLLQDFKTDAWSVQLKEKDLTAHDVAGTLKRFFRTLPEPLVTVRLYNTWIKTSGIASTKQKLKEYARLLEELPEINYNIMKKLMCHLFDVHRLHERNRMPLINLAPIWGPTLMNVDTSTLEQSYEISSSECEVVKDLIENCYTLFRVDDDEIARLKKMQDAVEIFHLGSSQRKCSGDMKVWIFLLEKDENSSINVTLTPNGTTHTIVQQICALNKIPNIENLTLHEVICNEALVRPLHPSEKVIEAVLRWSIWDSEEKKTNYLILKKNTLYPSLVHYAKEPKSISGELKFADSKSKSFRKYTFQFSQATLKYYKDAKYGWII